MYKTDVISREQWEAFLANHSESNFLHSWQWGDVHENLGQIVYRIGIFKDAKVVGVILAVVENARRGRYLEVPGGPIIDWDDTNIAAYALGTLRDIAEQEECVFVRLRPQLICTTTSLSLLAKLGLKKSPMHLHAEHTNIIDLTKSEDDLLTNMRRQTRYEVRRATKAGVCVSYSTDNQDVKDFCALQSATALRQHFVPPKQKFIEAEVQAFKPDAIRIYRADLGDTLLAMALVVFYGKEVDYHQGASTESGRNIPGAYALQWQIIQDAKSNGFKRYNLFGIAPSGNKNHRYSGVTTFKKGFGGEDIVYVPAHDLVIKKLAYVKNWGIEIIRKKVRRV